MLRLTALGSLLSALALFPVAWKWKIPLRTTAVGVVSSVLLAALPFLRLHRARRGPAGTAVALAAQAGLTGLAALALAMQRFWRDPERTPPPGEGLVLSAADGEVIYVRTAAANDAPLVTKQGRDYRLGELLGTDLVSGEAHVIGVEMNLTDVHVNRCPIPGRVSLRRHIGGRFISLRREEAPFVNERFTTVIENPDLVVGVVQIASRLVRRIVSYLDEGESVAAAQRLGMIRFGSLVAVVVPKRPGVRLAVQVGDRVQAGVSALARYTPEREAGA